MQNKYTKALLIGLGTLLSLYFLIGFLMDQARPKEKSLSAIMVQPAPDYKIITLRRGAVEQPVRFIAGVLDSLSSANTHPKFGVKLESGSMTLFALVDRAGDVLEIRRQSESGTIIQTLWPRSVTRRLQWAQQHDTFQMPGLPEKIERNLYH